MSNILLILDQPPFGRPEVRSESTDLKAVFAGDIDKDSHDFPHLRGHTFDVILVPKTITPDVPSHRGIWNYVRRMEYSRRNVQVVEYENSYY